MQVNYNSSVQTFPGCHLLLLWGLAGLCLMGCEVLQNDGFDPGEPVSYTQVDKAGGLHVRKAQTRVFRDSASWIGFWNEHITLFDENHQLYEPTPVNFNRRIVIAVFWGCRYVGCRNSVNALEGIYDVGDQLTVSIGSLPDLGPCRTTQLPVQVVSISASEKPIEFTGKIPEQIYAVKKCSPPIQCPHGNVNQKPARME